MRGRMDRLMDRRIGPPEWVHGGGGVDEGRGLGLRRASSRLGLVLPPFLERVVSWLGYPAKNESFFNS